MPPRPASAHQGPAAVPIGVGIDTSRYGHYAADLQTAAADLEVLESAAGYARHARVHFHVRPDAAGLDADNLLAWLGGLDLAGAGFAVSCGDTRRNKNYRAAVDGHQKSDPVEARSCARYALTERPTAGPAVAPGLVPLRQAAARPWGASAPGWSTSSTSSWPAPSPSWPPW